MGSAELLRPAEEIGLTPEDASVAPSGGGGLDMHELEVDPYDFLLQAEQDFEQGGDGPELNALTNAKRAIVCQMDQALLTFGYPATRWNIPKKIDGLRELGLVAPRILKRVSSARNLLEHEYRRPKRQDVEDALDLASLFVAAVKPVLTSFGDEFNIGNESERVDAHGFSKQLTFSIAISQQPATFAVWAVVDQCPELEGPQGRRIGETTLSWKDDLFPVTVRLAIAADRGFKLDEAVEEFCRAVCVG
jgi:hypothetical protein